MRKISGLVLVSAATLSLLFSENIRADEVITDEVTACEKDEKEIREAVNNISEGVVLIESGVAEIVTTVLSFVWNRVPNTKELLYDISLGAFIEIALKKVGLDFGNDNAAAKSIIRDISKVPSAFLKAFDDVEVGGTGLKFDTANIVSQIAKPLTKAGCILALQRQGYESGSASQICNYPGDFGARMIVIAGNDKQREKNNESLLVYLANNFNGGWIVRPITQIPPKNAVVDLISSVYARYKIGGAVYSAVSGFAKPFAASMYIGFKYDRNPGYGPILVVLNVLGSLAVDYIATGTVQLVSTICLATPARIVFDVVDWASGPLKEKAGEFYIWVFPPTKEETSNGEL